MSEVVKTVDAEAEDDYNLILPNSSTDSLYKKQIEGISQMRSALLSCDSTNIHSVKTTMQNILVMQLTRNMSRIVRFSEVMDRLEDRLYQSVDYKISTIDDDADPSGLYQLLKIQSQLIESMNESQKLLEPYLSGKYNFDPIFTEIIEEKQEDDSFGSKLLDKDSRERIRNSAQAVLNVLNTTEDTQSNGDQVADNTSEQVDKQITIEDFLLNQELLSQESHKENEENTDNVHLSEKRLSPEEFDKQLGISHDEDTDKEAEKAKEIENLSEAFDEMINEEDSKDVEETSQIHTSRTSQAALEALKLLRNSNG